MQALAENLWIMHFPMRALGMELGRTVTLIGLRSGELALHSTAPFTRADVEEISAIGQPDFLIEATLFHDTFAATARKMFPDAMYLAPEGFSHLTTVPTSSLATPPDSWKGELEVLRLEGMPKIEEHVFFHRPSRTLIVADLIFNFGQDATTWTRFLFRWLSGITDYPGMSRLFRSMIRDREAFARSTQQMMRWDFDRVIVGHGDIIETNGKRAMVAALAKSGLGV